MRVVIGQRYDCTMKVIINIGPLLLLRCLSTTPPRGTCGLKWESLKSAENFMLPSLLGFRTCPAWQVNVFTDFFCLFLSLFSPRLPSFVFVFLYFHPDCPHLPPSPFHLCAAPAGAQDCHYDDSDGGSTQAPFVSNCCCGRCDVDHITCAQGMFRSFFRFLENQTIL